MRAVLPFDLLPVDQPHEGLVDQRRTLQQVPAPFASQIAVRQPMEFAGYTSGVNCASAS